MSDFVHAAETCSCGACFDIEAHHAHLESLLKEWRKEHRHNLLVFAPSEQGRIE
jgi:hypothetical protein